MKNTFKLLFIIVMLILTNSITSIAQQSLTLYNMPGINQRMNANPAFFPEYSRINIGLPAISSQYVNVGNSGFIYTDLIKQRADDSLYLDFNNMLSKLAENNFLTLAEDNDILSFGFAVKKNYFSFNITEKAIVNFNYPKDFVEFLANGNGDMLGEEINFNIGLNMTHYREYGLGYTRKVNDNLTLGGKIKYLYGMENIKTEKFDVSLTTDPDDYSLLIQSDIIIHTTGLDTASTNNLDIVDYAFNKQNKGFGLDLGGVYKLNQKITLSASIIDLGFIKWEDPSHMTTKSKNPNASYEYKGVDINDLFNSDSDSPFDEVLDSLTEALVLDTVYKDYTTFLASKIYLGGNYKIAKSANAGVLLYAQIFNNRVHPALSLSFNQNFGKWFGYSVAYSMYNRSYSNLGFGFNINAGPIQWYVISDNIIGLIFPQKTKNVNLHFGFNLNFGRQKDSDGDGIIDNEDLCPDEKGTKAHKGCPDGDRDNISDRDDLCPTDSGSFELRGCPDRDGDKIIDMLDSCPDFAGTVAMNGCPDKDGDLIIDSKDKCPDEAGSKALQGCPDKDGDGIEDAEDECPELPGLLKNNGCPVTSLNLINQSGDTLQVETAREDSSYVFENLPDNN